MPSRNIVYVDPGVLARVDERISSVLKSTNSSAILLIERSGVVLASKGDPPIHPDQMGAVAAGVYAAMNTMMRATRSEEMLMQLPDKDALLLFQYVDAGVFLCAFFHNPEDTNKVRVGLRALASEARCAVTEEQTQEMRDAGSVEYIEEKLNELFGN